MKITIEPSDKSDGNYPTVTYDTGSNDDLTPQIVEAALLIIIASGHAQANVQEACKEYGERGSIHYDA